MLSIALIILLNIFVPPVDYDITLAGNFGEPRPSHFHGGLDIKTDNVEGKHIYAIADGYVSRVTVGLYGFGNAVYITHPTGHTSVYCHLRAFSPRIKAALRRYQYRHKTSVADARLTPLDVPVAQGQLIALSGNSGHSTGPHLHLELHDTRTWDMLDPYEVLADYINDSVPPQAHAVMAIPQAGGTFNGGTNKLTFAPSPAAELTAWGPVGFALWADDYMQGTYNHYGIRRTTLLVDGREVFRADVGRIAVAHNRQVNVWGDYDHYRRSHVWYMKSYLEPDCYLPMLWADDQRGVINFAEERTYRLEYVLSDYHGNEARYAFTVHAKPQHVGTTAGRQPTVTTLLPSPHTLRHKPQTSYHPGYQLLPLPSCGGQHSGEGEVSIHIATRRNVKDSHGDSLPTSVNSNTDAADPTKFFVSNHLGRYFQSEYHDGWITARVNDLSEFYRSGATVADHYLLVYDDEAPQVTPVSQSADHLTVSGDRLLLSVTDTGSGISNWTATVDDRFIVFDALEKTTRYACELRESWLRREHRPHRLHFEVTDHCQNTRVYDATFEY